MRTIWLFIIAAVSLVAAMAASAAAPLKAVKVAENAYAFLGDLGDITKHNRGRIGNSGFIVGPDGVVVVDTGVSYRHARDMFAAIRRLTSKPIKLAIITHAHQEFLFGAGFYRERGVVLLAHRKTAELMRSRCETCLRHLNEILGKREMRGTKLEPPQQLIDKPQTLAVAGLNLELLHFGWAKTPGDLAVFDPASGVLFAGGLIDVERVPEVRDSDLRGWQAALDKLPALPIKHVVPGHGPIGGAEQIAATREYVGALLATVRKLYDGGVSLGDATSAGELPAFRSWALYAEQHHKNVHRAYLQREKEELEGSDER